MGNNLIKITDFSQYNSLFLQLYKDKEKFLEIQNALGLQVKDIENAIFEVIEAFNIDTAEGVQLDIIGKWVDFPRNGRNDIDYRKVLKSKVIINSGSGEHEVIISALSGIYGATSVQLTYITNANLQMWVDIYISIENYNEIIKLIPSGVGLYLINGSNNPFVFENDPDGSGFGKLMDSSLDIDPGTGVTSLDIDPGTGVTSLDIISNFFDPDDGGEFQSVI